MAPPVYVRGVPGHVARRVIAWRQGGLINSAGADLPLTTAQLMAIADSATGG